MSLSPWALAELEAYGGQLAEDPTEMRAFFDLDRSIAVFEEGKIVGGAYSSQFEMSVPGGSVATAGVANVAVQATHRRRGILTRMMDHQLNDVHERGEPLAALFTSESIIYGRFGYGIGSFHERWKIERPYNAYARPYEQQGRISFVQPLDIVKIFPDVFRRSTEDTPGVVQRPGQYWDEIARDPEQWRRGASANFHAVYEENGSVDGYGRYRVKGDTLTVHELMAATDEARAGLWRFFLDVDLMRATEALMRPVDDPLPWMLADPRRLERSRGDAMWLRLVDVPAALVARRYMQSDRLGDRRSRRVLSVERGVLRAGRRPGGRPNAVPLRHPRDMVLSATDLASAYLGTARFTTLSQAGRVDELTPTALRRADAMFSSPVQPWTPYTW